MTGSNRRIIMCKRRLSKVDAEIIKTRIWHGDTQTNIALDYGTSVSLIGNIRSGHKWASAVWPNGKTGPLAKSRNKDIVKARKAARGEFSGLVAKGLSA